MTKEVTVKCIYEYTILPMPFFLFASAAVGFDLASSDPVFSCLALLPSELSSLAPPPPQTSSYLNLKIANLTLKNT